MCSQGIASRTLLLGTPTDRPHGHCEGNRRECSSRHPGLVMVQITTGMDRQGIAHRDWPDFCRASDSVSRGLELTVHYGDLRSYTTRPRGGVVFIDGAVRGRTRGPHCHIWRMSMPY